MTWNDYLQEGISNLEKTNMANLEQSVKDSIEICVNALKNGKMLIVAGNGGSMADSLHLSGELVNWFKYEHRAFPVMTLGSNSAVTSAWSNDHDYNSQLSREFSAYKNFAGAVIVFTTSGNSANIAALLDESRAGGIPTIGFISNRAKSLIGDKLDVELAIPVQETSRIQEVHIMLYHYICGEIERIMTNN
jgi:D-sedoheptulose 7-phosphate isomerase